MIDAALCSHSLCWNKRPFIATTTRLLHFYKFYKFIMPSKKVQSTDASRDTADGAPRHGGRPGTRAWAQAHHTADDAAAEQQADAPDTHLQEAGGDVAGAEDNSNAAAEPPSNTVGDDADETDVASMMENPGLVVYRSYVAHCIGALAGAVA